MVEPRASLVIPEEEAAGWICDGMTVAIGGFITSSHPMALVRQIIRRRIRQLTIVGAASAGPEIDMLVAGGCVRRVIAPHVGAEALASICPCYRRAVEQGEVEVWEVDEGMYYAGLRAAAQMLPFAPWRAGLGTSLPEVNPDIKVFEDPIRGEKLLAIPAIAPDVALILAGQSDPYGNVQHNGTGMGDRALHRAAKRTIVQVERIVPNEDVRREPARTSIYGVYGRDAIVLAPYGSHPFASPGYYLEDVEHLREYLAAASEYARTGSRTRLDEWLGRYLAEPATHLDYLERIGIRRLVSLHEYRGEAV